MFLPWCTKMSNKIVETVVAANTEGNIIHFSTWEVQTKIFIRGDSNSGQINMAYMIKWPHFPILSGQSRFLVNCPASRPFLQMSHFLENICISYFNCTVKIFYLLFIKYYVKLKERKIHKKHIKCIHTWLKNDINKQLATKRHTYFWIMRLPRLKWNIFSAVWYVLQYIYFANTERQLAFAEGLFAFHTINHNQWLYVTNDQSKYDKKLQGQKQKQLFVMFFHEFVFTIAGRVKKCAFLYKYMNLYNKYLLYKIYITKL